MVKITKEMLDDNYVFKGLFSDIPNEIRNQLYGKFHAWLGGQAIDLGQWTFVNNVEAKSLLLPSSTPFYNDHARCGFINRYQPLRLHECGNKRPFLFRRNGTEIIHTKWHDNEPDKPDEKCLMLYGDTGRWNDNVCFEEKLTFCQRDTNSGRATATPSTRFGNMSTAENECAQTKGSCVIDVILGSLLAVCVIVIFSLVLSIIYRNFKAKKSAQSTTVTEEPPYSSNYEVPVVHEYVNGNVPENIRYQTIAT